MSEVAASLTATAPGDSPSRESVLGVLGVLFGLLLLAAAFLLPLSGRAAELDADRLLSERFVCSPLPFDFEPLEARRLPAGEELVLLGSADETVDFAPTPTADSPMTPTPPATGGQAKQAGEGETKAPSKTEDGHEAVDWSALPTGEEGRPPARVALIWVPRSLAAKTVRDAFRPSENERQSGRGGGGRGGRWSGFSGRGMGAGHSLGPEGGQVALDGGEMSWGEWGTNWIQLRTYERHENEPRFRDIIRVNLSLPGRTCILHAAWQPGLPADISRVKELLAALAPKV